MHFLAIPRAPFALAATLALLFRAEGAWTERSRVTTINESRSLKPASHPFRRPRRPLRTPLRTPLFRPCEALVIPLAKALRSQEALRPSSGQSTRPKGSAPHRSGQSVGNLLTSQTAVRQDAGWKRTLHEHLDFVNTEIVRSVGAVRTGPQSEISQSFTVTPYLRSTLLGAFRSTSPRVVMVSEAKPSNRVA